MYNILYWETYIRKQFIVQINLFVDNIIKRFLPTFDSIEEEADKYAENEWESIGRQVGSDSDPSEYAEMAYEAGIEYYQMLEGIKHALLNIAATTLFHMFEQQAIFLLRREILNIKDREISKFWNLDTFRKRLKAVAIDITSFESWEIIYELKLVSNTVKHAEGWSADELRKISPYIFSSSSAKRQ